MKKPNRSDGLALSEILYNDNNSNLTNESNNNNCPIVCRLSTPKIAEKDGRNMAVACRSVQSDNETTEKVFEGLKDKYCLICQSKFKVSFWKEMEEEPWPQ